MSIADKTERNVLRQIMVKHSRKFLGRINTENLQIAEVDVPATDW
jgi:hypothetical protein